MENATKALLIAAAVLIVILIVSLGMSIFNSTGDNSEYAQQTGETIDTLSISAKTKTVLAMTNINNEQLFVAFLKKEFPPNTPLSAERVRDFVNIMAWRSEKICGTYYNENGIHITSDTTSLVYFYYNPKPKGKFIGLDNLKSNKKYYLEYYDHRNGSVYVREY